MTETATPSQQHASMMISYSRKDKVFVQQLHASLLESGIPEENIWIDWEDIPPAADWMDEITRAIGGADTFVFVISPESLDSKVCGDEVRVASENNKKIIPILHREPTKNNTLQDDISRTNWVYMRENDDYDAALPILMEAINTDLEWVREHTRILERAIEWNQEGQDKSFLLRGSDLDGAETWQAQATEKKEPQPTHLQAVYIQDSREDAKRRRRNLLIGVSIALLVSIVLGITAVIQWRNFQTQSQLNLVRQLAAQATSKQEERLDLASLISLEANRLSEVYTKSTDQTRAEVTGSLLSVVMHKPALNGYIYGHTAQVYAVDMNLETGIITTASADGTVRLIDLDKLTLLHLFEKDGDKFISAAINPDGTQIAIGAESGTISLWNAETYQLIHEVTDQQKKPVHKILYNPDGSSIAAVDNSGVVVEYDAETLEVLQIYAANDYDYGVAYHPTGTALAIGSVDGYIEIFDLQSGEVVQAVDTGLDAGARSVAFNREGTLMASGGGNGLVQLWDVETGENLDQFTQPGTIIINSLVFDHAGDFLAVGTDSRDVILAGLKSDGSGFDENINFLSAHVGEIFSIAISDDGNMLLSGGIDQTAILWNVAEGLEGGGSSMQVTYPYPEGDVNEVEFSPDGNWLAFASDDSTVYVQDLTDDEAEIEKLSAHEASVMDIAIHPGSSTFASSNVDGVILLWDTETGEVIGEMQQDASLSLPLAFHPDGSLLAAGSMDGEINLWDTTTQKQVATLSGGHETDVLSITFSPDGSLLASGSLDYNIVLWDVATGEPVRTITTLAQVPAVLFSQDGQQLFSGGYDAMIRVWDVNTGEPVTVLAGHLGDVNEMAFSSDGKMLISGSADGTVILWDMTSLERIGFLSGSPYSIIGVAFSPTQPLVAAASRDDSVYTWDVSLDAWKTFACFRANRNLTQAEWNQYIGEQEEYHLTCPDFPPPADLTSVQN